MEHKTETSQGEKRKAFLTQPVANVKWVPIEKVVANDYNPNKVASTEMRLLYISIKNDGYTQPVVTIYDPRTDKYVIVDGFHRYSVMRHYKDIREKCDAHLPIVVIDKNINDRIASTVRHNRARGKHSTQGMSQLVFKMLDEGWTEDKICNELGMEAEEIVRLKYITGFAKLYEDAEYKKAWQTRAQIRAQREYRERNEYRKKRVIEELGEEYADDISEYVSDWYESEWYKEKPKQHDTESKDKQD